MMTDRELIAKALATWVPHAEEHADAVLAALAAAGRVIVDVPVKSFDDMRSY